jgi:hypothetical protein
MLSEELFYVENVRKAVSLPPGFKVESFKGLREIWIKPPGAGPNSSDAPALSSVVSLWENENLYDLYGSDFRAALDADTEIAASTMSRSYRPAQRILSLKVGYAVLTTLVAVIGALVALRGYFDYFFEEPSIGIYRASSSQEGSSESLALTAGKPQILDWRVFNHGRTEPARITKIAARLSQPNDKVTAQLVSASYIPKLPVGDERIVSVRVESKATAEIELIIEVVAEAGVLRKKNQERSGVLKINTWDDIVFVKPPSLLESSEHGKVAVFGAELGFGRGDEGASVFVLQLLRQRGVHFVSLDPSKKLNARIDASSQNEDSGSEVATVTLTPQDLKPLSSVPIIFKLVSDVSREDAVWKQIGAAVNVSK